MPTFHDRIKQKESFLTNVDFSKEDVKKILHSLDISKSPGPDNFHPRILKELSNELSEPLFLLFSKLLIDGILPKIWKDAHVTPVYKKGEKCSPGNYRSISLTSVICKTLEKLIRNAIVDHMEKNSLFNKSQHGFMKTRSCMTQLLETLEEWTDLLDKKFSIDVIYLDFQKAFDTIPHQRLLSKVHAYGIRGQVYEWIRNFLLNRRQRVVLNISKSNWTEVISGVPQGSVLGPILFILHKNDLPDAISCVSKLFADDTKLYRTVDSYGDSNMLQMDLYELDNWSESWQMKFNIQKCKVLHLGKKNPRNFYLMFDNENECLSTIKDIREQTDLGVQMDESLRFEKQISNVVQKANGVLASIKRTFKYINIDSFPVLYKSLVRPHLEYCNSIWSPYMVKDIKFMECVQRRATKIVPTLSLLPYEERLKLLDLPTLKYRRRRGDMIITYKMLNGLIDIDRENFFQMSNSYTRGHCKKLYKPFSRLKIRSHFFSQRVIDEWNSLPNSVVSSVSLSDFKRNYDTYYGDKKFKL